METIKNGIVFSDDIRRILNGKNALDFSYDKIGIPSDSMIESVRKDFKENMNQIFDNQVRIITEEEMTFGLLEMVQDIYGKYPIVTLDKIYLPVDGSNILFLDCTRLEGSKELVSRNNVNDIWAVDKQIDALANILIAQNQRQIVLADDVVFTGTALRTIVQKFLDRKIAVVGIRSAVATIDPYEFFNAALPLGLSCSYVLEKDVIDQICERDFYFGIAGSGISMKNQNGKIMKAPYFIPFGDPVKRASIPKEQELEFSKRCISRSIALWKDVKKTIYVKDLPEEIQNAPLEEPVIKVLERGMRK